MHSEIQRQKIRRYINERANRKFSLGKNSFSLYHFFFVFCFYGFIIMVLRYQLSFFSLIVHVYIVSGNVKAKNKNSYFCFSKLSHFLGCSLTHLFGLRKTATESLPQPAVGYYCKNNTCILICALINLFFLYYTHIYVSNTEGTSAVVQFRQ